MVYGLYWFESDIEDAEDDFSSHLADDLESALEEKERQIKWKNNINELNKRFHNSFNLNGLHIVEIAFESMSGDFRAICVVLSEKNAVIYYTTVPKKGSFQRRQLEIIREKSDEIEEFIRNKADRLSS